MWKIFTLSPGAGFGLSNIVGWRIHHLNRATATKKGSISFHHIGGLVDYSTVTGLEIIRNISSPS